MNHRAIIASESRDVYNQSLRKPSALILAAYTITTLLSSSSQELNGDGVLAHKARDTQSSMLLHAHFSRQQLGLHAAASIATLVLMLLQKEIMYAVSHSPLLKNCDIPRMYRAALAPASSLPSSHRILGRCICVMMFLLAALGYSMRFSPNLPHFQYFSLLFAAPW
jgi:hypothetical protein